jgi:integrase
VKPNLRRTTWDGYSKNVAYVTARLGSVPLQLLQPVQLEACCAGLTKCGGAKEHGLVSCRDDGEAVRPDWFTRYFRKLEAKVDVTQIRGPHDLRHTWATLALKAGVHPKVVSDRLGHSTLAITLDIYSHVSPTLDADAANTVASEIFGTAEA